MTLAGGSPRDYEVGRDLGSSPGHPAGSRLRRGTAGAADIASFGLNADSKTARVVAASSTRRPTRPSSPPVTTSTRTDRPTPSPAATSRRGAPSRRARGRRRATTTTTRTRLRLATSVTSGLSRARPARAGTRTTRARGGSTRSTASATSARSAQRASTIGSLPTWPAIRPPARWQSGAGRVSAPVNTATRHAWPRSSSCSTTTGRTW